VAPATNASSSAGTELDREKDEEISVAGDPETAEKIGSGFNFIKLFTAVTYDFS
jgi:hypothetical protein